jgi:TPR repeat protein
MYPEALLRAGFTSEAELRGTFVHTPNAVFFKKDGFLVANAAKRPVRLTIVKRKTAFFMKNLLFLGCFFLVSNSIFGQTEPAVQVKKAYEFYEKKDFENAFIWYKKAADQNASQAQFIIGIMFEFGQGCEKSPEKAFIWYKKAADQDYSKAMTHVGSCYFNEIGTKKNLPQALKYLQKPADEGDSDALLLLGFMYHDGIDGIEKDLKKAISYYQKSADLGEFDGASNLGKIISFAPEDYSMAEKKAAIKTLEKGLVDFKKMVAKLDEDAENYDEIVANEKPFYEYKALIIKDIGAFVAADEHATLQDYKEAAALLDEIRSDDMDADSIYDEIMLNLRNQGKKSAAQNFLEAKNALAKLDKTPQNAENMAEIATDYTKNIVILANWQLDEFADATKKAEAKMLISRAKTTVSTLEKNIEAARIAEEKKAEKRAAKIHRQEHRAYPYVGLNVSPFFRSATRANLGGHVDFRKPRSAHSFGYAKIEKQFDYCSNGRAWSGFDAFYAFKKFGSDRKIYTGVLLEYADKTFVPMDFQVIDLVNGQISNQKLTGLDKQYSFLLNYGVQKIGFLKFFGFDLWMGIGVRYNQLSFRETTDFKAAFALGSQNQDEKVTKFFDIRKKENQFLPQARMGMSFGLNFAPKRKL